MTASEETCSEETSSRTVYELIAAYITCCFTLLLCDGVKHQYDEWKRKQESEEGLNMN